MQVDTPQHADRKLWKVHNKYYDLSSYLDKHPGGIFWLETTQGQDVTDFFETYHINSEKVEAVLKKFFVKDESENIPSPFTFEENGFYKTLKRKIAKTELGKHAQSRRATVSMHFISFLIFLSWITSFAYMGYS